MARPQLKICGLRQPDQASAVAALGVDAIGVIAVERSPRFLAAERRPALFAAMQTANPLCRGVLVVADPGDDRLAELGEGGHRVVQLHGSESVARCRDLRQRLGAGVQLWKALRIGSADDLVKAQAYTEVVDALLLDAWVEGQLGGTGRAIPLQWLQEFRPSLPWWLAGGIGPETVGAVLETLSPDGLDASSRVELSPGDKDLARVAALVRLVKGEGTRPASARTAAPIG
ncbi:phosphoribosylanthranilate isomerase [Synechococcus sp. CBW1107]|uniref:phosphoribosylanthranilate isomerase n=1 Tax=Synechococcus sp. CBW1107 TaxID=2789857 RepID=UPI002AD52D07|nr:phosphoribosylanthranilate isomerase [Synechococcus sp. CBW1107]CAK6692130.1 N-(5'-phosphoribosyl)anthranilate isomerase [Synechococcus sp. CBW1107]